MRHLWICIFCTTLLSCGGAQKNSGTDEGALSEKRKVFIDTFWEEEQVAHYIATIDALIDRAIQNASVDESVSGRDHDDTNNGVRIIISLTHRPDTSLYHVSFSHRPYLASSLAKKFTGLIALRLGFPIPPKVMVSQNQVFHLEWTVPNSQKTRDILAKARTNLRAETSIKNIANTVFLKTLNMEIEEFVVQGQ